MSSERNVLVIVGRAVSPAELVGKLVPRAAEGVGFTVLVPAIPSPGGPPYFPSLSAEGQGGGDEDWRAAADRAERAGEMLLSAGIEVRETIVGDADLAAAAGDVLHTRAIDDVVVLIDPGSAPLDSPPDLVAV